MKLQVVVVLVCVISFIWIQQISCDDLSDPSDINKWTCKCTSSYQANQSFTLEANCSTSCDCTSGAGGEERTWTCMCAAGGFPKVAAEGRDSNCFTACNCSSGFPNAAAPASKRHISSKVVVIILLLCVILTTLAFLASVLCYFSRRDKCPHQSPVFSSDRETSYNSFTNLISYNSSSILETRVDIGSPINKITGCFRMSSCLFRSKTGSIIGTITQFSYSELENATDKFTDSNLIGLGGSSFVYRGRLKDGRIVAVKRLKTQGGPDSDSLFLTEIELLSRLHHCHVVPLLGYCSEFQGKHAEQLLVYEYMPNGNLRDCLDRTSGENMDWEARVAIAIGAARGLEYLHEAAAPRILHRDVKSTNILLDENRRAKITDLGMAKRLRADGLPSCSNSPARMQGTFGYFAPEYAIIGRSSLKSDVFSFGVVILELITGRHPIHKSSVKGEESLVIWATPRLQDSRRVIKELPDPRLNGVFPEEDMQIMAYLAKECLLLDPDARPSMREVVQILSSITPDKSRWRNIPSNLFQGTSACGMKNEPDKERTNWSPLSGQHVHAKASPVNEVKLCKSASCNHQVRCSLPLEIERTLCVGKNDKDTVSAEYMKRLIHLTSKASNLRASDDEMVDLTEPRFESFCVENLKSL